MNCTMSAHAAEKLKEILNQEEEKELRIRAFVSHAHDNHAHYGLGLDVQKETDECVLSESGVEVLLERGQALLDGIAIDYDPATDEWSITNPNKGNTGDH